jgi:hypothetical protein
MKKKDFISNYSQAVYEGYAAIFTGAGTSVGAGFVDWKELVRPFAEEIELDIDKETDLVKVTQYYQNTKRGRGAINERIMNAFSSSENITETIKMLTRLPISTYWTTNYDQLLEEGLKQNNRKADVKITDENLAINKYDRDAVVYKMHGDVSHPSKSVITKDDYETYSETHSLFTTALKGDLVSKTFLFLGFSFEDPNLDHVLAQIKILLGEDTREHYCFLKEIDRNSFDSELDYKTDKIRQELRIEDLKRYGIYSVLLNSYDDIPEILSEIEKLYLNKSIFISGSISSYDDNWSENSVNNLCYRLSKELVKEDYKVISGFGLGIGSSIINGALDEIYKSKYKHVNEHLSLYPFPQVGDGKISLPEMWSKYRNSMISDCGICIFLFGNKVVDEKVVIANGMLEEFEIAKRMNKLIIPICSTGGTAKEIFEEMKVERDNYKYLDDYWSRLEKEEEEEIINMVLEIISRNQK